MNSLDPPADTPRANAARRKRRAVLAALALMSAVAAASLLLMPGCSEESDAGGGHRVIVLGFDGMDPRLTARMMEAGQLPTFQALKDRGDSRELGTSIPPQSPVAWANFITGQGPGGHGIFDFIHRDPRTYLPQFAMARTLPPSRTLRLGSWVLPLTGSRTELLRRGKAFWQTLEEHGIPTSIIRVPSNYPPVDAGGRSLSGMGTPDLRGTYGTFSLFGTKEREERTVAGGQFHPIEFKNFVAHGKLPGPYNDYRLERDREGQLRHPLVYADFTVWRDPANPVLKVKIQDTELILKEGEWSDWVPVTFKAVPLLKSATGICRFHAKQIHPDFELYVTPINIDPADPASSVSTPADFAADLSSTIGRFYTQGTPEDTKALEAGALSESGFLAQSDLVLAERLRMLDYELSRFHSGFLFLYFSTTDAIQHMYWRSMDKGHPLWTPELDAKCGDAIGEAYRAMDKALKTALDRADADTTVIVISDHGFAPLYRTFNPNSWLMENGYLATRPGASLEKGEFLNFVDWQATEAYALGLNGLYLNLAGREAEGVVQPGRDAEKLTKELCEKLEAIRDPKSGQQVLLIAYDAKEVYHGPCAPQAPDLILGYNRGYRVSWEAALGKVSRKVLADNTEKWSGDHCIATELVPGIVFSSKPIRITKPSLIDLAPTILTEFGLPLPDYLEGRALFGSK